MYTTCLLLLFLPCLRLPLPVPTSSMPVPFCLPCLTLLPATCLPLPAFHISWSTMPFSAFMPVSGCHCCGYMPCIFVPYTPAIPAYTGALPATTMPTTLFCWCLCILQHLPTSTLHSTCLWLIPSWAGRKEDLEETGQGLVDLVAPFCHCLPLHCGCLPSLILPLFYLPSARKRKRRQRAPAAAHALAAAADLISLSLSMGQFFLAST